ncbi:MAG: lysophospholipid acyltransferase family protein [Bacteroidia bacterium]|nr:lysophospholipid acyltransferase family protein [Bacteroidia bacterium]
MKRIVYFIFLFTVYWFKITPFRVLYLLSGILYFALYYIVRYRKEIVISNLRCAFPDKTPDEIMLTAKRFYRHLGDITLESIKGYTLGRSAVLKRYTVANPEILEKYYHASKNIICLASHYGNWEWGVLAVAPQVKYTMVSLYKPLSNLFVEKFIAAKRAGSGMKMVSIYDTKKSFELVTENPTGFIMAADQCPSNIEKAIWVRFLDKDTACLHGAEYYTKKYNMPVLFFDVQKRKRGNYILTIKEVYKDPVNAQNGEVTAAYMKLLEQSIRERPEYWLWSHKRWKHSR